MKKILLTSMLCFISIALLPDDWTFATGEPFCMGRYYSIIPGNRNYPRYSDQIASPIFTEIRVINENVGYFVLYNHVKQCEYKYHVQIGDQFGLVDGDDYYYFLPYSIAKKDYYYYDYKRWDIKSIENNLITFEEVIIEKSQRTDTIPSDSINIL